MIKTTMNSNAVSVLWGLSFNPALDRALVIYLRGMESFARANADTQGEEPFEVSGLPSIGQGHGSGHLGPYQLQAII